MKVVEDIGIAQTLMGLLVTIALGLAGFALKWQFDANAQMQVMQQRIEQLANNKDKDEAQDKQLKAQWTLHNWERDQILELRVKTGLPITSSPSVSPWSASAPHQ